MGDGAWCGEQARKLVLRPLRPLGMVDCLRDTATIPNAEQLARTLITRASPLPSPPIYWLALMRTSVTAAAAVAATARIARSLDRLYGFQYTAAHNADRADLARRQVFLPSGAGGLGRPPLWPPPPRLLLY